MIKVWLWSDLIILIMVIVSPFAYSLWIGDKASVPFQMTIIVALYTVIHSLDILHVTIINGIGLIKLQTYITIIGLVLHIPFSLILGQYIGCYGVLISMTIIVSIYLSFFIIQVHKLLNNLAKGIWAE